MKKASILLALLLSCSLTTFSQGISQQLGTDIDGEAANDWSGQSVSMNAAGDRLAIGAHQNGIGFAGHVRVYDWNGTGWTQVGNDIDGAYGDQIGFSVSMNAVGDRLAIGAPNGGLGDGIGRVRIYDWNGTAWVQLGADIDGEEVNDDSGASVSMNAAGDRLAIGAKFNDVNGLSSGHVRIYDWDGTAWIQVGTDIDGNSGSFTGYSVSMNAVGDRLVTGAPNSNLGGGGGQARIYDWDGIAWVQVGVDIYGEASNDDSGYSVSMNSAGDRLAIGAPENDGGGSGSGHVRIYDWDGTAWIQVGTDIDGETGNNRSGHSVSMNATGDRLAIGAINNSGPVFNSNTGHVRIYDWDGTAWVQYGADIDGEAASDYSGHSVSMNAAGDILAIGAFGNSNNAGHVRIYGECGNTGTDIQTACNTYDWIDGNTYTASNNTAQWTLTNAAGCDSLVTLDLTVNYANTGTDVQTACNTYEWIDGNTYTASNNNAQWTLTNAAGCDSLVTLDLTINSVSDLTTSMSGLTITATNTNATYQWLDCDNNFSIISGETNQSYTPSANGNYAVELTESGCIDTSACESISTVGIIENSFNEEFTIYPNPTDGMFSIGFGSSQTNITLKIMDASGKLIINKSFNQVDSIAYELNEPKGMYLIELSDGENQRSIIRLIKQ